MNGYCLYCGYRIIFCRCYEKAVGKKGAKNEHILQTRATQIINKSQGSKSMN